MTVTPDKDLFHAMALYVTKKKKKDIEALVQGRSFSTPAAAPSWRTLLDIEALIQGRSLSPPPAAPSSSWKNLLDVAGEVFKNLEWKEQDPTRTTSFANNLEKMFLKTPAESDEEALHIGFLFCSLLKLKGTPSSDPKLLELCQLYLTKHPEINLRDGTTFTLYIPKSLVGSFPGGWNMFFQNRKYEEQKRKETAAKDYHEYTVAKTDSARKKLKGLIPIIVDYNRALEAERLAASNLENAMRKPVDISFPRQKDKKICDLDLIGQDFLTEIKELLQGEDDDEDQVVRLVKRRKE